MKIPSALAATLVALILLDTMAWISSFPRQHRHHSSEFKARRNKLRKNATARAVPATTPAPHTTTGTPPGASASTCPTDGFSSPASSCICNFAGACDLSTDTPVSAAASSPRALDGFAPQNMEAFAYKKAGATSVGTICEKNTVAVLYDCNGRVPLYAATVLEGYNTGNVTSVRRYLHESGLR